MTKRSAYVSKPSPSRSKLVGQTAALVSESYDEGLFQRTRLSNPRRLERVFHTLPTPSLVLGPGLQVLQANESFATLAGVADANLIAGPITRILHGQFDQPALIRRLQEAFTSNQATPDVQVSIESPSGTIQLLLTARRLPTRQGRLLLVTFQPLQTRCRHD